jgi:hypothetical protein
MELIQPAEISGKIMTLIDKAEDYLVIVSPYNQITKWEKLRKRFEQAKERGVKIDWYIRKGEDKSYGEVRNLGITPIEVENLHCKIYLNEKNAIVTSMNLYFYSIEIGYEVKEKEKHAELLEFINDYIIKSSTKEQPKYSDAETILSYNSDFITCLSDYLKTNYSALYTDNQHFRNQYFDGLQLNKFKQNYKLIFEPKKGYFRIDLRIEYPHKIKVEKYNSLKSKEAYISNQI